MKTIENIIKKLSENTRKEYVDVGLICVQEKILRKELKNFCKKCFGVGGHQMACPEVCINPRCNVEKSVPKLIHCYGH